jgi:glutamyl-tRNA synthetase
MFARLMIKTRFAPSPTGFVHIGSLRTALYAYLFAKQHKGHFILRIEDTDQARYVEGAIESLLRTLEWAGLEYDEGPQPDDLKQWKGENGPYIQSQRTERYQKHAQILLEHGQAYRCLCSLERLDQMRAEQQAKKMAPMYDKKCLNRPKEEITQLLEQKVPHVVRLNVPWNETLRFRDTIRGDMEFDSNTIDDQVLLKSDGFPTYHLANVVDDHFMEVTHVIRGEEWLPSTPKHIYLYRAFDWKAPEFAHIPLLLNKDKTKLSKRQNDVAVEDYIAKGYLPEAVLNFIALLGWHPGEGETQEIFSLAELVERFSLEKVHKAGAVFDPERLGWFNGHYVRQLSVEAFTEKLIPFLEKEAWFKGGKEGLQTDSAQRALKSIQPRIKTLSEAPAQLSYLLTDSLEYDLALLENEKMKVDRAMAQKSLQAATEDLQKCEDFASEESLKICLTQTIERLGLKNGQVLWPLRVALTGQPFSPGAFEMGMILGKERTLKRIATTLERLKT